VAPERLYVLSRQFTGPDGKTSTGEQCAYPMFRNMRALVKNEAELIAVSSADRIDLTFGSDEDTEKAYQQYVSGWIFQSFGIRPALGRVFTENDDLTPGAHPYAVVSYDYWQRRFAGAPDIIGRTFRTGNEIYQIVGVADGPFTGTEPGRVTDIFIPTMMRKNNAIVRSDYQWFRTFVHLKPGVDAGLVREKLHPGFRAFLEERALSFLGLPKAEVDGFIGQKLMLNPAPAGSSGIQKLYGTALAILGALVLLVLMISCANVANLMTARATARQREMALRVSIGAGRMRLVQLVVLECAWLALFASILGGVFASWAAPFVVDMISAPDYPLRLILPADWRVFGFGAALALACTLLFGLGPALRASHLKPVAALRGGAPNARSRVMQLLIALQVAFCVLVLFVTGLFVATSRRLSHQPLGFSPDRLLTLETVTPKPVSADLWSLVADHLRSLPGVESVAISEWPLMTGSSWNGFISVGGAAPNPVASYFLSISTGWLDIMRIPLVKGRDFISTDTLPGTAIVNEAFAREYFNRANPVGKSFDTVSVEGRRTPYRIVGLTGDARYKDLREPIQPTAYFQFKTDYSRATFIVRTSMPASALRQEISRARPGFRVSKTRTQTALIEQDTMRERLLSVLALFFGTVALLLAAVGLYGVLDYSVLQRRREIGIRIAIGARSVDVVRRVTQELAIMVLAGCAIGVVLGIGSVRFVQSLLFEVRATDPAALTAPTLTVLAVSAIAAVPGILRAVRIDPAVTLRSE